MEEILKHILGELKELRSGQETLRSGLEAQGRELKELRSGQETLRSGLEAQGRELKELRSDLVRLSMHVEHDVSDKIRALYDHREIVDETLARIEAKLDRHDDQLALHLQEIAKLKVLAR